MQEIPRVDFGSDDRLVLALARGGPRFCVARSRGGVPHGLPRRRQELAHDAHGCCAPHGNGGEREQQCMLPLAVRRSAASAVG